MLKNVVYLKGKLLAKNKLRDNFSTITIMTNDFKPELKNYPRLTCSTARVNAQLDELNVGDYVTVEAHIGDRKRYEDDKIKTIGCIYVNEIRKNQSLAESFGFNAKEDATSIREFQNEFQLVGFVDSTYKKGNRTYISLLTPKKVVLVDFNPHRDYSNIKRNSFLCVKGIIKAGKRDNRLNKNKDSALETLTPENTQPDAENIAKSPEEKFGKYTESYVVSQIEEVSTAGLFRE